MKTSERRKIAILGGGAGAMAAAFGLTDPDNPQHDQYEVTVYQLGWRLGGKGASGRNMEPDSYYRIEEHGLHVWFGCYDNAFHLIRKCYAELGRAPDAPLASWQDAFKPHNCGGSVEVIDGHWDNWLLNYPTNDNIPGQGQILPLWDYLSMALQWMHDHFEKSPQAQLSPTDEEPIHFTEGLDKVIHEWVSDVETKTLNLGLKLLRLAHQLAQSLEIRRVRSHQMGLVSLLTSFMAWYWHRIRDTVKQNTEERRRWILLNLVYANVRGVLEEDVLVTGFDALNDKDYLAWVRQYVFPDEDLMITSPIVLAPYYGEFAYLHGDLNQPNLEAGTTLRLLLRMFLTYRGAVMWKFQAGMGDTIFAPLYQVLKQRGVKFKFFHRVKRLIPSVDNKTIEQIEVASQVTLKPEQEAKGGYDPLIEVKGLPCWPSRPLYDQIVEGEQLKQEGIDLEAYSTTWQDREKITYLKRGEDFDEVVLGISLGALPYICGDLIKASLKWRQMVDQVKTIRTQAFQLWLKPTAYQLGWTPMGRPLISYNVSALNTWGDMSQLIDREGWPVQHHPLNIAYFCGPMPDDVPLTSTDCGPKEAGEGLDQVKANQQVRAAAIDFLNKEFGLWPNAVTVNADSGERQFKWELLVDPRPGEHQGQERFDSQFWRANIQPSERYVLSVAGSSKYRLPANDPAEFTNLYLAGDWTANGLNLGCVEAAVMSGLLASNGLTGYPRREEIIAVDL